MVEIEYAKLVAVALARHMKGYAAYGYIAMDSILGEEFNIHVFEREPWAEGGIWISDYDIGMKIGSIRPETPVSFDLDWEDTLIDLGKLSSNV